MRAWHAPESASRYEGYVGMLMSCARREISLRQSNHFISCKFLTKFEKIDSRHSLLILDDTRDSINNIFTQN